MTNQKKLLDLHLHSFLSDGMKGIDEVVRQARRLNLAVISLTDHNTIAGVKKIIKFGEERGIIVIPGIEIYTRYKGYTLHLLGYNFDIDNSYLNNALKKNQKAEIKRVKKIISKFKGLGLKIAWPDVQKRIGSKFIDAGHIASVLLDFPQNIILLDKLLGGLAGSKKDAIQLIIKEYINQAKPAYAPLACFTLKQAIKMIHGAGGFIILGHPGQTFGYLNEKILKNLIKNGLDGLEAISRHHLPKQDKYYLELAKKYDLRVTGGTDWHDYGDENRQGKRLKIPYSIYLNLKI
jgi:predicted metal-dependent phosphoesterase TrpH